MKEYDAIKAFLVGHWLTICAIVIAVALMIVLWQKSSSIKNLVCIGCHVSAENFRCLKTKLSSGYRFHILGCLAAFVFLTVMPIWLLQHHSKYFDDIMKESAIRTVKFEGGVDRHNSVVDDREILLAQLCEILKHDAIHKNSQPILLTIEHSRAPAIFVLVFLCFMYTFVYGAVFYGMVKCFKLSMRESLLQRMEVILEKIDSNDISEERKAYLKKILENHLSCYLDNRDGQC